MDNNRGSSGMVSGWQSPVPYLLGGVLAMILLVAVALIILAFSNWKKSPLVQAVRNEIVRTVEESNGNGQKNDVVVISCSGDEMEGQVTVIMAGDEMPTFLARPTLLAKSVGGDISVIVV